MIKSQVPLQWSKIKKEYRWLEPVTISIDLHRVIRVIECYPFKNSKIKAKYPKNPVLTSDTNFSAN